MAQVAPQVENNNEKVNKPSPVNTETDEDAMIVDAPQKSSHKFGLGKAGMVFAAGTALFSDGYSNGVVSQTNLLLSIQYADTYATGNHSRVFSSLAFAGTIVGQLTFGYVADKVGRKSGMMLCSIIIFVFSALSAGAYGAGGSVTGLLAALDAYRFLIGVGIGGEYPAGSVAAAENSAELPDNRAHRYFILATNTAIDFGFVASSFAPLIFLWIAGTDHLNLVWRLSLGFGAIPALLVFFWRLRMRETTSFTKYSMKRAKTPYWLIAKRYWARFLAIAVVWFIYDFIVYPFGIYSSVIVNTIIGDTAPLYQQLGWATVINCFYLPGTILGALINDKVGPKRMLVIFLTLQCIVGFLQSGLYTFLATPSNIGAFAVVYGIFLSFGEAGPGNNIGLLASKTSPTPFRGQFYGLAAACGKCGAFAGTWAFPSFMDDFTKGSYSYNTAPFYLGAAMAGLSATVALFFVHDVNAETMRRSDIEFVEYLRENGYPVETLGLHGEQGGLEAALGGHYDEAAPPNDYLKNDAKLATEVGAN